MKTERGSNECKETAKKLRRNAFSGFLSEFSNRTHINWGLFGSGTHFNLTCIIRLPLKNRFTRFPSFLWSTNQASVTARLKNSPLLSKIFGPKK